jgi:hypothetical protein
MKTYRAFMQRVVATAVPQANFTITAYAQYPGYKCLNALTQVR